MGINYKATIIVGAPTEMLNLEDGSYEYADEVGMDVVCAYYDASDDARLIGYKVFTSGVYDWKEIPSTFEVENLKQKFKKITGIEAKLYLSCEGS